MPPLTPYLEALADGDFMAGLTVLFALLIAHALCDHPLQGDFLALHKNRKYQRVEGDLIDFTIWPYCLTVHALIHAGGVWVVTGSPTLALVELGLHWIIDFLKEEKVYNFHVDQLLHVLCKIGYVVYLANVG